MPENTQKPYCIALYDYTGDHVEDLSFKVNYFRNLFIITANVEFYHIFPISQENDKITLKRYVNEEWLEGELNGRKGIFPLCFVKIMVPLPKEEENDYNDVKMITLFDYHAQSWDDLELKVIISIII